MAFTYRNVVQRELTYAELDENFNTVEQLHDATQTALADTETARDLVLSYAGIYVDTTAGLAATADGQYFSVQNVGLPGYLDLYLNDAGVATFVETYPGLSKLGETAEYNAVMIWQGI